MPSDVVSIAVSTGLGVSVFAGIISGVCYVLVCGFTSKRKREPELQWLCAVCGIYLRLCFKEKIKIVICSKCEHRVCKRRCSRRDSQTKEWICYLCLKQPSFFQGILNVFPLFNKKKSLTRSVQMGKNLNNDELNSKQQRENVRDFIEKLVSTIVGGSVDDASVFRIYSDTHYNVIFDRYYQDLSDAITNLSSALQISMQNASFSEQSPSSAHTSLKLLIEKILREVVHLPHFRKPVENATTSQERTYEDLLATAILNKIINKNESPSDWSSAENLGEDDRISTKYRFRNRNSESKWNETESASVSSTDDYVYSDSSHGSTKYVDRVSLTIQQRIEQVPSIDEHDDIDADLRYFNSKSSPIDDNSNWYLQKREFQGTASPVPVPMLVPNPITSAKVLIGDQEIDDTSDLSDANSECNDVETSGIANLIIDSSLTIEEKAANNYSSDEQTSFDSGVREDDCSENLYYAEPRNVVDADEKTWDVEDSSLLSSYSNVERDSEYLEKYSSIPTKMPPLSEQDSGNSLHYHTLNLETENQEATDFNEDLSPLYEGRYSKREKEKWRHPVNMPYNPYSEENIRRRIQSNQRFGRDYYTKQASLPSGRIKTDENDDFFWTGVPINSSEVEPVEKDLVNDLIDLGNSADEQQLDAPDLKISLVQNHRTIYEDGKTIEIRVNDKTVNYPDDFLTEPFIGNHHPTLVNVDSIVEYNPYQELEDDTELEITKKLPVQSEVNDKEFIQFEDDDKKPIQFQVNKKEPIQFQINKKEPIHSYVDDLPEQPVNKDPITLVEVKDTLIDHQDSKISENKVEIRVNKKEPYQSNFDNLLKPFISKPETTIDIKKPTTDQSFIKPQIKTRTNKKEPVAINVDELNEPFNDKHQPIETQAINTEKNVEQLSMETVSTEKVNITESSPEDLPKNEAVSFGPVPAARKKIQNPEAPLYKEPQPLSRQLSSSSVGGPKKSDNTLIKKIYANPVVRSFALTNREQIPGVSENEINKPKNHVPSNMPSPIKNETVNVSKPTPLIRNEPNEQPTFVKQEVEDKDEVAALNFSLEFSDNDESLNEQNNGDLDCNELKEKRLVASRLGQFSKSFPNLLRPPSIRQDEEKKEMIKEGFRQKREDSRHDDDTNFENEGQSYFASVKDLRKLFEKTGVSRNTRDKPVHSLTARSISKEIKQKLSNHNDDGDLSKKDDHAPM